MSLTDSKSVLILGAGTSAPFGLPLGGDLIDLIRNALEEERRFIFEPDQYGGNKARSRYKLTSSDLGTFFRAPIHGAVARRFLANGEDWSGLSKDDKRLQTLGEVLRNQTSETIDDFIVENPGLADLTKIAIAAMLLKKCYRGVSEQGFTRWRASPLDGRVVGKERNWVHLLINIIRHAVRKGELADGHRIPVVTFNYDRVLEYVLEKQFANTEAKHKHYSEYLDIMHVHGAFTPIEDEPQNFAEMTLKCASGIHVVNEPAVPQDLAEVRARAKAIVAEAEEIYCVGFSFAGPNCKLLGLADAKRAEGRRKTLRFCNYDGNVGVKRSAEAFRRRGILDVEEAPGTIDRTLSVTDWLKSGHLGELPG